MSSRAVADRRLDFVVARHMGGRISGPAHLRAKRSDGHDWPRSAEVLCGYTSRGRYARVRGFARSHWTLLCLATQRARTADADAELYCASRMGDDNAGVALGFPPHDLSNVCSDLAGRRRRTTPGVSTMMAGTSFAART